MKKYVKATVTVICLLSLSLVGCSASSTTTTAMPVAEGKADTSSVQVEENVEEQPTDEVFGKITTVLGTEVTLALGTMDMSKVEAPTGEAPTGEAPTGEAPTGEKPIGEAPSGKVPNDGDRGKGQNGGSFIASGEEINVEIDDNVNIKVMQDGQLVNGTIEDLTEESIVRIAYDGEDKVVGLQVMGGNSLGKKEK